MTIDEIITNFELQVDDMTELSSTEELAIANRVRRSINRRPLEANRKSFAGVQSITLPYITLPDDFYSFAKNYDDNDPNTYGENPVIFTGSAYNVVQIVPFGDRRQYRNNAAYAYIDFVNNRIYFASQPLAANAVEFDYYALPEDLLAGESDWITTKFPEALIYGMACEDSVIQQSDKAKSYLPENSVKYKDELANINIWNAKLLDL